MQHQQQNQQQNQQHQQQNQQQHQLSNLEDSDDESDDAGYLACHVGYSRPKLVDHNIDLSDRIMDRLALARELAMQKYREIYRSA